METNKAQVIQDINKEEFAHQESQRQENVDNLRASIYNREVRIKFQSEELRLKNKFAVSEYQPIDPKRKFETTDDWCNYVKESSVQQLGDTIEADKEILVKEKAGLAKEELKLKLIKQGIPAWNMSDEQAEEKNDKRD